MRQALLRSILIFWSASVGLAGAVDWPRDLNSIPAADRADIGSIETLIHLALNPGMPEVLRVAEFRFVPLEVIGRVDLIASVDFSGRGLNSFVAVWRSTEGYASAVLPSYGCDLAQDVLDMEGTGVYSIVAGEVPGGYQGIYTMPIPWYGVYALKSGRWTNVSDRYPHFSRTDWAVQLVSGLADACEGGRRDLVELYRDNALFVRFKYNRMVMHDNTAGLETAMGWANSPSRQIRILAVETLCGSGDPRAIATLKKLSESQESGVVILAKGALEHPETCRP